MTWTLAVCIGVTWAGCGSWVSDDYPTEEACQKALSTMVKPGNDKVVAYCYPKKEAKDEIEFFTDEAMLERMIAELEGK